MNWITNYVRPRINSIFSRRDTPENLWTKCDECGTMLFHRELRENLNVCTSCGHHMAITPRERFEALFDGGVFTEIPVPAPLDDPLKFRDQKKYPERMKAARAATGETEAMLVAEGNMGRTPIVAAAQEERFSRRKHDPEWPAQAIAALGPRLRSVQIGPSPLTIFGGPPAAGSLARIVLVLCCASRTRVLSSSHSISSPVASKSAVRALAAPPARGTT